MVGKLAAKDSSRIRQFKVQIHQSKGRGQKQRLCSKKLSE